MIEELNDGNFREFVREGKTVVEAYGGAGPAPRSRRSPETGRTSGSAG